MAADEFDGGWGDDPFSGDIGFDTDFDGPVSKGIIHSLATGFLHGLYDKTIGTTDGQLETLKKVLPSTFQSTFNSISDLNRRRTELMTEIKEGTFEAIKDLQFIADAGVKKLRKIGADRLADMGESFSTNDFSGWEKYRPGSDQGIAGMENTSDEEVTEAIASATGNAALTTETLEGVGDNIVSMLTNVGGRTLGQLNQGNNMTLRTNQLLEQVVDYQRRVQARNDALKLNVLTRTYLTNVKFYKFVEASNHRIVKELRDIAANSAKSDYEKTTNSQYVGKSIRDSVFNTVKGKLGGIANYFDNKFNKGNREETYNVVGDLAGSLRMAIEMSEGQNIDIARMVGDAAAGVFINNIPRMLKSDKAQSMLERFKKDYPEQANRVTEAYAKLKDVGNISGNLFTNGKGIANSLAKHYNQGITTTYTADSYEEYLELLPEGQEPLPKYQWTLAYNARKLGNGTIGSILDEVGVPNGSYYDLKSRTLSDNQNPALWSNRDSRTLNEEIPHWLAQIHLSMEKIRTGNDSLKAWSYDYTQSKFVSESQREATVLSKVFDKSQFGSHANIAKSMVNQLDKDGALDTDTKSALALKLAKDQDAELGFTPYNYLELEKEGFKPEHAAAIKRMIQNTFGITDDHIDRFKNEDDVYRTTAMLKLPTEEGRALQASLSEMANSLSMFTPDITKNLDVLHANGFLDALKSSGAVKTVNGRNSANMELFWDTLNNFIKDPDNAAVKMPLDEPPLPNKGHGINDRTLPDYSGYPKFSDFKAFPDYPAYPEMPKWKAFPEYPDYAPYPKMPVWKDFKEYPDYPKQEKARITKKKLKQAAANEAESKTVTLDGMDDLKRSIMGLNKTLGLTFNKVNSVADSKPITAGFESLSSRLDSLITLATARNEVLTDILTRQPAKSSVISDDKAAEIQEEKRSIIDRLKAIDFKGMFNKSIDTILDNQPLVLGGLLGGLAGIALHNPKAAALLGGGAAIAIGYSKFSQFAAGRSAEDTEDLYEEGSDTPILEAAKLRDRDYYDMTKGFVIKTWNDIVGSVKDISNGTIIGGRKLAGKLFTADNKEVFLKGLSKVRELAIKGFKLLDPLGRFNKLKTGLLNRFYQMDVYREGDSEPVLIGKRFGTGAYYKRKEDGSLEEIKGWNEIDGPVYTAEGDTLITREEYDRGLKTSMGVSVNKLQDFAKKTGKLGLDIFNKIKDKAINGGSAAIDKAKESLTLQYTPIVTSIDRIYNLLLKHWGYTPDPTTEPLDPLPPEPKQEDLDNRDIPKNPSILPKTTLEEEKDKLKEALLNKKPTDRLNSNEDKKNQARAAKDELVKDSIISISERLGAQGKEEGTNKEKPTGLFGMLLGGFGKLKSAITGIGTFFVKRLLGGFTTLFKFGALGLKIFPVLATGIAAVAKGVWTLVSTRSLSAAGGSVMDTIRGGKGGPRTPKAPRGLGGSLALAGKAGAAAYGIDMAGDMLKSVGIVEEGSVVDKGIGVASTGAAVYAGYTAATGLITAAGGAGALATVGGWLGAAGTAALGIISSPIVLGVAAAAAVGYGTYRYITRGSGSARNLRMSQYGLSIVDGDLAEKMLKVEELLKDHVVIGNGRASFSKNAPIEQVMAMFVNDKKGSPEIGDIFTWFNGRVKPVYLTYMACLDVVKMKSLQEYDESKSPDVYKVAKQANQGLSMVMPFPYSITAKVDPDTPIMGEQKTIIRVNNYLEDLRKYIERKSDSSDLDAVDTMKYATQESLTKEKAELERKLNNKEVFGKGSEAKQGIKRAQARLQTIDQEINRLNTTYKANDAVKEVYVGDMLVDGRPLDMLTAIRVAAYGNVENITWRVESVLKLERYCEQLFTVNNGKARFNGMIGDLFNMFKGSFRLDKENADDWCLWFRDRFLPVMTVYMESMQQYRRGKPGVVWKTLSATARFEIAQRIVSAQVEGFIFNTDIWAVRASPFKDSISGGLTDKVRNMLKLLNDASTTAKLKDPEGEAGKTNASTWAKTVAPHKVGGGYQQEAANTDTVDKAKNRRDVAGGGQFSTSGGGTGNTYGANGVMGTPANKYGFLPIKGATDTSHLDMSGVKQQGNAGDDKGVSVPKPLAQQIIIREMLKQGFTDPRQIAEMLALTEYESQGYSKTTENMKYSSPERLVKLFKEVTNINQARQLVNAGEVAIANTVYGGGKGASLGNTEPGDGWKYRGRGFVQLTGKSNYAKIGNELGVDLVNKPELASTDPNVMAAIAVNFFKNSKLLQSISTTGDFGRAATGLNGGNALPGMSERYQLYLKYLDKLQKGELGADGDNNPDNGPVVGQTASGLYGGEPANGDTATTAPASNSPGDISGGGSRGSLGWDGNTEPPMIGQMGTPSLISSPSGGSAYSGGGTSLVNSNPGSASGLRLKSEEAVGGGEAHPGIKRLCQLIQQNVPGFKYFSALNDRYHVNKGSKGAHPKGLAADFTLVNGVQGSDQATAIVTQMLLQANMTKAEFIVINEYRNPSSGANGGHVHVGFKSPQAAQKFLQASGGDEQNGQDTTGGGMVGASNPAQPAVPPSVNGSPNADVSTPDNGGGNAVPENGGGNPLTNGIPKPPVSTGVETPVAAPQVPVKQQPAANAPVPVPAPAAPQSNADLIAAIQELVASGNQNGAAERELLSGILNQLVQSNKQGAVPPKAVNLN